MKEIPFDPSNTSFWHNTGMSTPNVPERITELIVDGKKVCIVRSKEQVFAFAPNCPHAGAPLCEGWLDPVGRIVCPLHKYRFDPANGRNTTGEGYKLFTYAVAIHNGDVWVGFVSTLG